MSRLSKLEPIVKNILEVYKDTRADDMYLYYVYIKTLIGGHRFDEVFYDGVFRKYNKISPYHSVARCRRKLQATYPELRPEEKVQETRLNETSEYINYAIDGYNPTFMKFVDSQE